MQHFPRVSNSRSSSTLSHDQTARLPNVGCLYHTLALTTKTTLAGPRAADMPSRETDSGPFPDEASSPLSDEFEHSISQPNVPLTCLQAQSSLISQSPCTSSAASSCSAASTRGIPPPSTSRILTDAKPIVTVSIQYRLGVLGYTYTASPAPANCVPLLWVQKFIARFGERQTLLRYASMCSLRRLAWGPLVQKAMLGDVRGGLEKG